jgi:hypothetical protein
LAPEEIFGFDIGEEDPATAGRYRLVTDEDEILGLSFLAFRRVPAFSRIPSTLPFGGRKAASFPKFPPPAVATISHDRRQLLVFGGVIHREIAGPQEPRGVDIRFNALILH